MKWARSGCTVCLLAIASVCHALEPLPEAEFPEVLETVHLLNRWNPEEAARLAEPAEETLAFRNTLENEIRYAVAVAPARSLQKGYRPVRSGLVKLLSPAQESANAGILVPEIRFGLSDLALRNGEIRFSLRQIIGAFQVLDESVPDSLTWRLLEQAARINLAAGHPFDSLHLLDRLERTGGFESTEWRFTLQLLRAEAFGDAREFDQMAEVLDSLSDAFRRYRDTPWIAAFWVLKSWEALYRSNLDESAAYLKVARQKAEISGCVQVLGEIEVLEAYLGLSSGMDPKTVTEKLKTAAATFKRSGDPGRYAHLLIRIDRLPREGFMEALQRPFLEELAVFAHHEESLRAHYHGLAAWGQLMLQDEEYSPGLFADAHRRSLRYRDHFAWTMGQLQLELLESTGEESTPRRSAPESSSTYYLVILLLLLLVMSLVLALRIHTQQHVNRQLAEAVAKAEAAEAAAEESNRLKSQFLANVSHEIKTPMSGLVGMASLLDELIIEPSQRKYLETIRTCSENLLVLMNDLLDLGRMESGRFEIEPRPVRPIELVNYGVEMVREAANRKDLEIIQQIEPDVPSQVICDGIRIGQILTNLLNNAIKFTERGLITLHLRYEQTVGASGNLVFEVKDTGIGISPDRLASVFEPFNQGAQTSERKETGSGLGLAICKKLTEFMGGSIRAESEPGNGSCFTVRIPVTT
jgi:signal transduction histidine kinase